MPALPLVLDGIFHVGTWLFHYKKKRKTISFSTYNVSSWWEAQQMLKVLLYIYMIHQSHKASLTSWTMCLPPYDFSFSLRNPKEIKMNPKVRRTGCFQSASVSHVWSYALKFNIPKIWFFLQLFWRILRKGFPQVRELFPALNPSQLMHSPLYFDTWVRKQVKQMLYIIGKITFS